MHEGAQVEPERGFRSKRRTKSAQQSWIASERTHDVNSIDGDDDDDWRSNALNQQDTWRRTHGRQVTYSHQENNQDLQQILLGHMIGGKFSTDDFVDEKVLYTENKEGVLRMNTWRTGSETMKTINCARLTSVNHQCSNGMIHMVNRIIGFAGLTFYSH
jgi:uncharacterized surface protein with fasciclin (FAS1) repeats